MVRKPVVVQGINLKMCKTFMGGGESYLKVMKNRFFHRGVDYVHE